MAILSVSTSFAQTNVKKAPAAKRKSYFVLHLGGGYSYYIADVNIRSIGIPASIQRSSGAATARLMWYPNHRLRLGIETGFTNFYSYRVKNGNTPGRVSLNAIPLLLVWSMPIVKRINIYAGFGSYILTTHLDYNGVVNSKTVILGSNVALAYTLPLSTRASIAAEAKYINAFETKDAMLSLQVQMIWKFIQL